MRGLTATASTTDLSLVPWIPLLVALIVAVTTIGTSLWNTRGESAALRQLKAMNEAIEGMPMANEARGILEAARDRLALRISERDTRTARLRATLPLILGSGALLVGLALQLIVEVYNPGTMTQVSWGRPIHVAVISLGTVLSIGIISAVVRALARHQR